MDYSLGRVPQPRRLVVAFPSLTNEGAAFVEAPRNRRRETGSARSLSRAIHRRA